jgi:hypothetical protein
VLRLGGPAGHLCSLSSGTLVIIPATTRCWLAPVHVAASLSGGARSVRR